MHFRSIYWVFVYLHFPTCKMGMIVPTTPGCESGKWENCIRRRVRSDVIHCWVGIWVWEPGEERRGKGLHTLVRTAAELIEFRLHRNAQLVLCFWLSTLWCWKGSNSIPHLPTTAFHCSTPWNSTRGEWCFWRMEDLRRRRSVVCLGGSGTEM